MSVLSYPGRPSLVRLAAVTLVMLAATFVALALDFDELARAMYAGDVGLVKAAIKKNPQLICAAGGEPLRLAASSGRLDMVRVLLANHADVRSEERRVGKEC